MHILQFRIAGDLLVPEDLATLFKMQPKLSHIKGEEIKSSFLIWEYAIGTTHYQGSWLAEPKVPDEQSIEKAIEDFIYQFSPFSKHVRGLVDSNKYNFTLWLTIFPEDVQLHFRISPDVISRLFDMGITFGVSIMSLQDIYAGRPPGV